MRRYVTPRRFIQATASSRRGSSKWNHCTSPISGCAGKLLERQFRRSVLAQKTHVEMPVIGRTFGLPMPRRRRPGRGQVVKAVPLDPIRPALQESAVRFSPQSCTSSAPKWRRRPRLPRPAVL